MASSYGRRGGHDRKDGRLLHTVGTFGKLLPHIARSRCEATGMYDDSFDVSNAERWLKAQNPQEFKGMGHLHLFIAAYIRAVAANPEINRFVAGRRIYARDGIEVAIPIRRDHDAYGEDSVIKVSLEASDTVYDVYRKISSAMAKEENSVNGNASRHFAKKLAKAGKFLRGIYMLLARILDYFGFLPQRIMNASPFHSSVMVHDMSDLAMGPVAHQLYNVGTLPVIMSLGSRRTAYEFDGKDSVVVRRYVDVKFSVDTRITDSEGFASAFKTMKKNIENPGLLELPPQKFIDDIR